MVYVFCAELYAMDRAGVEIEVYLIAPVLNAGTVVSGISVDFIFG